MINAYSSSFATAFVQIFPTGELNNKIQIFLGSVTAEINLRPSNYSRFFFRG